MLGASVIVAPVDDVAAVSTAAVTMAAATHASDGSFVRCAGLYVVTSLYSCPVQYCTVAACYCMLYDALSLWSAHHCGDSPRVSLPLRLGIYIAKCLPPRT